MCTIQQCRYTACPRAWSKSGEERWNCKKCQKQECIPVGCVPSAAVVVSGRCLPKRCLPSGKGCLPSGGCLQGGVHLLREQNDWQTVTRRYFSRMLTARFATVHAWWCTRLNVFGKEGLSTRLYTVRSKLNELERVWGTELGSCKRRGFRCAPV